MWPRTPEPPSSPVETFEQIAREETYERACDLMYDERCQKCDAFHACKGDTHQEECVFFHGYYWEDD